MTSILELRADYFVKPNRLDVAAVEAMMLWPDDENARWRAMQVALALYSHELHRQGRLPSEELAGLVDLAIDAEPERTREAAARRFEKGLAAGEILFNAVAYMRVDSARAKLGPIVHKITQRLVGRTHTSSKIVHNTIWRPFRPVAHFWAAVIQEWREAASVFPCRVAVLPRFLAIAEEFRRLGESTRPRHARQAVLPEGESVLIPAADRLPKASLNFSLLR